MEVLHILEEKIARLIESKKQDLAAIKALNEEVDALKKENKVLIEKNQKLEDSFLAQDKSEAKREKEQNDAKVVVDELINSIDKLIGKESAK